MPRLLILAAASMLTIEAQVSSLVDYGAEWRFRVGFDEASAPDRTAWRGRTFNDASWESGQAPIGYSTSPGNPAEQSIATFLPTSSEAGYTSVFLRKTFNVVNPAAASELVLNVQVDDGFIAWLNGTEIARFNVPDGELTFDATASSANEPSIESVTLSANVPELLEAGENVLAIHLFNGNFGSSDLVFDASLQSNADESGPVLASASPPDGAVVPELTTAEVVFNESVQGVSAGDLLVNGVPATGVSAVSPRDYVFTFPEPATGKVSFGWAAGHGISDLALNPFSGVTWSVTLDPTLPPSVVVISEFLADNENGIRDEDGSREDWIELLNTGGLLTDLEGWFLTDDPNDLSKWRIPAVSLDRGDYLLIWASSKNRSTPGGPLHTNFRLGKSGGYLALVDPNLNVISEFTNYPAQQEDISYGRDQVNPMLTGYFSTPTPGEMNVNTGAGFAPLPVFSRGGGFITNNSVTVSISAPAGQIRYTLDGSAPGVTSPLYTGPITITTSTAIKARVYQNGLLPSAIVEESYFVVDSSVARFESEIPLLIFSTLGDGIVSSVPPGQPRTYAMMAAIDTFRGKSSPLNPPNYIGSSELEGRGQTSAGFPKTPYNLELQNAYRQDQDFPLLGLPAESDWVLNNPYSDKPFLQNFLAFELHEKMGHYAVRRRFVEVFVNTSGGKISYPRDYRGIYLLLEKIKVDGDRTDLEKLTPADNTEPRISGGYMFKKDKDSAGDRNFSTSGGAGFSGQNLKIHEPKPREITTQQMQWLNNYLNTFEDALYAWNWRTATGTNHYSHYIDVDSFVDYHWIVEFAKQIDGYRLSNYMQKDRGGKIKMEPIWDWNLSFGNADYLEGANPAGWYHQLIGENDHIWLRRLINGSTSPTGTAGDPDFNQRIADRWSELRTNVLAASNVLARIDEMAALLGEAAKRDFQKWPRLGTYVWPNPPMYVTPTDYPGIIAAMKNWIQARYNWIDSQFILAPELSSKGGPVAPGFRLNISQRDAGQLYYTTNGSDPRIPGGGVSPDAVLYNGAVPINGNSRVVARIRNGGRWSGPAAATFQVAPPSLVLTEIMYHPAEPPAGSPYTDGDFEFLEFRNLGSAVINLGGYRITHGVEFTFPPHELEPGDHVLVVNNLAAFESRYGTGHPVVGEYSGGLDKMGERLRVESGLGEVIADFTYDDDWHSIADGTGFSLVPAAEKVPAAKLGSRSSWRPSSGPLGSPGVSDPIPGRFPRVVINEAVTNPGSGETAKVELKNLADQPADVSGWFLSDNVDKPMKFRIPSGTIIPAGGFVVFTGADFQNGTLALDTFNLNPAGEEIALFSGDANTNLTGYLHWFEYNGQEVNGSLGRQVDSSGDEYLVPQVTATPGGENSGAALSTVIISEVMYRPPDVLANGMSWDNTEDEYIELFNRGAEPAPLFDPALPANTWKISEDAGFAFPAGASIPAESCVLVVSFDPIRNPTQLAAFRSKYGVPAGVQIFGPYSGLLSNKDGDVNLSRPGAPIASGSSAGVIPEIRVEALDYGDASPWPAGADGLGHSLTRIDSAGFVNEPGNWTAAAPTPGVWSNPGDSPVITEQPAGIFAPAGQNVTLNVAASGQGPLRYQWRKDGQNITGATGSSLAISGAEPAQSGAYTVVVLSGQGSATSRPAQVVIAPDADSDGMDDEWEFAHLLNPFRNDSADDLDGDGVRNDSEYIAGTHPGDASSYLAVSEISAGSGTRLRFRASANRGYTIEFTDSLAAASNWRKLADVPGRVDDEEIVISDPESNPGRFYRLRTPIAP